MKKLILALLATGAIVSANAQSGSILLYGNAGVTSITDASKNNNFNWNVNPGIGYQFNNNWTVGLNFGFGETSRKDSGSTIRTTVNNYNVGPFVRYSHSIAGSNIFSFYAQLDLGYMGTYTTSGSLPSYNKATGFGAGLTPAISANVCHGFALNFGFGGIGFNSMKADGASNSTSTFNFTLGQQVNIGVSKNFGGHKMHGHHEPGDDTRRMDDGDNDDNGGSSKGKKHHKKDGDDE